MDTTIAEERIRALKKKFNTMSSQKAFTELLEIVQMHPDAMSILGDMKLIDKEHMLALRAKGCTGYALTKAIMNQIEIRTSNSTELSIKMFGYNRMITPSSINNYIDIVATRIQQQKEYTELLNKKSSKEYDDMLQEEELTLDELEEFY